MKRIVFSLCFIVILMGCSQQEIKEGQVYVVQDENYDEEQTGDILNIEGRIPFQKYVNQNIVDLQDSNRILLTIAPSGEEIYLMERMETTELSPVIKGDVREKVRIIREDMVTKDQVIVAKDIPFVSKVRWNTEGNIVSFGGGDRLTIYDAKDGSIIMEGKLAQDPITGFFWAPTDENKIYTEQPNLANGSIYYLASQRKVEAYETREETYYKGKLNSDYYYGTKWDLANGNIKTVILDKQGKTIKVIIPGIFRDSYEKSLVVVGEEGFGLSYVEDINNPEDAMDLTKEYVYDVKFIADGKIAYTTKAEDIDDNLFYLHIVSNNGSELKRAKVYGANIALLPDGNSGYISGPVWQKVDFLENKLFEVDLEHDVELDESKEIYSTIRGAMMTLYDFQMKGEEDRNRIEKYFKNTRSPEQWAYFDVTNMLQENDNRSSRRDYAMRIDLKSYVMDYADGSASVVIDVNIKNSYGRDITTDYALELSKSEERWYVTGFSTFPHAVEREEIEKILQETIEKIRIGKLFPGKLEDKEITLGQVQFWLSRMPRLAPNIESANAVKVFLQVNQEGREEVYKLVLEKVEQNLWQPTKLTQEDLSSL
ncbi:hypothetical protein Amet_0291 [Alkaliphilus metalliredigens QYMF]|uniref:Lipoprotein n=1 Tax=Alkaliphilus metalliredigens (strain QYMF) TaxID=293826 RepID=A6TK05_ALKMQ|nr:hypothetical protein [Alkaliphilus metalliredigens]ABR46523.1 hypothetical protein Amet_0291 [Alkaliphilus metalliredigens QYMF]